MISAKLNKILLVVFLLAGFKLTAQDSTTLDSARYDEVRGLVSFYEYLLNAVGDRNTPTRDKEVVITESYKKAFNSAEVQIEDDLLANRQVITNKDVSAYLRDVDFFFEDIVFTFSNLHIQKDLRETGEIYYLVKLTSNIDAVTVESQPYNTTFHRYIEINENKAKGDLKIASVYTTKVSRITELRNWWERLSYEWVRVFKNLVPFESVTDETLLQIEKIDSINLQDNQFIQNLAPLEALRNIRFLSISNTKIKDLSPLRYSMKLEELQASNTNIQDISVLNYFTNLKVLDVSETPITKLSGIEGSTSLSYLNLSGTNVLHFNILSQLQGLHTLILSNTSFANSEILKRNTELKKLDLARTGTTSIEALTKLTKLEYLDLSETYVGDLNAMASMISLVEVFINQTTINSLLPLTELPNLKKVHADYSGINEQQASEFMKKCPKVVVINNSEHLLAWWNNLSHDWQKALSPYLDNTNIPGKEAIIKLLNIDSLDVSKHNLLSGEPLAKFKRLIYLDISKNLFVNLSFTSQMTDLETLIGERLPISNCEGLGENKNLTYINLDGTQLEDIDELVGLNKLRRLDIDHTKVNVDQVRNLLNFNSELIIIFETEHLIKWWNSLSSTWQKALNLREANTLTLHQLVERQKIEIKNTPVTSLRSLDEFIDLREVSLSNTGVTSLIDLNIHRNLVRVACNNGPLMDLKSVSELSLLKELDVSNTAIDDLRPLSSNKELTKLDCSGTNIKRVKGLDMLKKLEYLNISNTRVWQLERLYDIRSLNTLVCYNTRVRGHKIEEFKQVFPDCSVTFY